MPASRRAVQRCRLLLWLAAALLRTASSSSPPPSFLASTAHKGHKEAYRRCPVNQGDVYSDLYAQLPNKTQGRSYLAKSLRMELIKYGELTQLTYDGFYRRTGKSYWVAENFFKKANTWVSDSTKKYRLMRDVSWLPDGDEDNFLYAKVDVFDPAREFRREPGAAQLERDFNHNMSFPRDKDSAWIGYIAVDEGAGDIVVAFRGTLRPDEWKANILGNFLQKPDKNYLETLNQINNKENRTKLPPVWEEALGDIRVHDGFLRLFHTEVQRQGGKKKLSPRQQMQNRLLALVRGPMKGKVKTITFVGHSLGGALATIAAGYTALAREIECWDPHGDWAKIKLRAITFSAPRVGGPKFRRRLNDRGVMVLNTINAWDVVPAVPGVFNAVVDSIRRTGRQTPVTGESFALPLLASLDKVPVIGFLKSALTPWNYANSGIQLAFNSGKPDRAMRTLGWDFRTWLEVGAKHNLEGLLYMIAKQYTHRDLSPEVFRDIALMNKGAELLKQEVMKALDIPARWWQPQENKGMQPTPVKKGGGTHLVIFRDAKPVATKPSEDQGDGSRSGGGLNAVGVWWFVLVALALVLVLTTLQQRKTSVSSASSSP